MILDQYAGNICSLTDTDHEPHHAVSPTALLLEELAMFGYRPHADEPDPRPLPTEEQTSQEIGNAFDALSALMAGTRLEDDLADVLWSLVNIFHRKILTLDRLLDDNEQAQRRMLSEQDGSEVKSAELERLTALGISITERRNAFEAFREIGASRFEKLTWSAWRPRSGSMANRKTLTAAMIDSRDYIAAKRKAEIEPLMPAGPRIAFTGGIDCSDYARIWAALDKALAKHPEMVLIHGGSPKGAEKIASLWACAVVARRRKECSNERSLLA